MCTRPITITKKLSTGSVSSYTVPCGKCSECRSAYQSEFAFMCFLEAEKRNSLHFFTLTYNNDWLPVAWCDWRSICDEHLKAARAAGDESPSCPQGRIDSFQRGSDCYDWQLKDWCDNGCRAVLSDDGCMFCPTLYREDIKNWLKRFRQHCKRNGISTGFSFACFGEYGENRHRPHYHLLVAGLDDNIANLLGSFWHFGYYLVKSIPRYNPDGSDGYALVSEYVSKYICKRDKLPDFVQRGFAQLPRRQTSIHFGKELDFDKLRPFILRKT